MEIISDYSLTKSFITKDVVISIDNKEKLIIHLRPLKDFYENHDWIRFYSLIKTPIKDLKDKFGGLMQVQSIYDVIKMILIQLGGFKQFKEVYKIITNALKLLGDTLTFNLEQKKFFLQDIEITEEIWDYIIYLIRISNGEKIKAPQHFNSEEERLFYLAQQEYDEQIAKLRQKESSSEDAILKILLSITYAFPNLTFDYLFEQTLAQIRWLQGYAAGATSYEVNAKAFAAGNMKKGSKLNFFIK